MKVELLKDYNIFKDYLDTMDKGDDTYKALVNSFDVKTSKILEKAKEKLVLV